MNLSLKTACAAAVTLTCAAGEPVISQALGLGVHAQNFQPDGCVTVPTSAPQVNGNVTMAQPILPENQPGFQDPQQAPQQQPFAQQPDQQFQQQPFVQQQQPFQQPQFQQQQLIPPQQPFVQQQQPFQQQPQFQQPFVQPQQPFQQPQQQAGQGAGTVVTKADVGERLQIDNQKGTIVHIGGQGDPPFYQGCYAVHMDFDAYNPNSVQWFCMRTTGATIFKLDGNGNPGARLMADQPGALPGNFGAPPAQGQTLAVGNRIMVGNNKGVVARIGDAGDPPVYKGCYAVHYDFEYTNPAIVQWICLQRVGSDVYKLGANDMPTERVPTGPNARP